MAFSALLPDFRKMPQLVAPVTAPPAPAEAVCLVGDMIDRGPDSAAVLARVRAEHAAGAVCLMGNHEEMFPAALAEPACLAASWLKHGGYETLIIFGLSEQDGIAGLATAPGTEMRVWLTALPLCWRSGNMVAAHAGMDPAQTEDQQEEGALLRGHPDFGHPLRPDGLWVARGHAVTAQAEQWAGCISRDTGAYATGRMSCAVIDPGLARARRLTVGAVAC